ncbi:hypothetical protein FRC08_006244 [Ceratobasidium sp. 394]|nr:hypothetical protein FRC08_006244 [Ceratobasidium sp. 394]
MSYSLSSTSPEPDTEEPLYDDLQDEFVAAHARIRELEQLNERTRQRIAELEEEKVADILRRTPHQNAVDICAWHAHHGQDPAQPPKMAQPGILKCGCTLQEALFEESLARYGVGSMYLDAKMMVRLVVHLCSWMLIRSKDPALRRPLLQLLQKRYNYISGEFERAEVQKSIETKAENPNLLVAGPSSMDHAVPSDPGVPIATQA